MRATAVILGLTVLLFVGACDSSSPTTPASHQVVPNTASLAPGSSVQLTLVGPDGNPLTAGVAWRSDAPHVVDVSTSGNATAMFGDGPVLVRGFVGGDSAEGVVTVLAACQSPLPLEGSPPARPATTEPFEVRFDEGVDTVKRAQELADQMGFEVTEMTPDGFIASLNVTQVSSMRCVEDVAAMIFV